MVSNNTIHYVAALTAATAFALLLTLCPGSALAGAGADRETARHALSDPAFRDWLTSLREEAHDRGISDATLDVALRDVTPVMRVIELDRRQPEFTRTFWNYLDRHVTEARVRRGRALLEKHRRMLEKIRAEYGIPPRYLIALWGLETNFGDHMGGFRVIDALVTLAYDRRRAGFFRGQLLNALKIVDQGHILPDAMTGSWAGAMGHMQFIPSTFIGYAVDQSGDGRKDIWKSLPDAFASAANYLSSMGWQPGKIWGREVRLPKDFDVMLASMRIKKPIQAWSALGVRRVDGVPLPLADIEGAIVLPQGFQGPAFLVYDNFRVLLRWNRSLSFALSVGHLADRIVGRPQIASGREAEHDPLSHEEIKEMQRLLNRLGFDAGEADGVPGRRTQEAIRALQLTFSLPPDGYPSPTLLQRLHAISK